MDLRKLEIVKAVAETGSFTAAARLLHVSQSAISRQVLLLEEEPLFVRLGRKVRLTQTGEALLQLSHRVLADVRETTTAIVEHHTKLRGTMHLVRIIHERCALVHNAPAALVHPARRRADGEGNGLGVHARPRVPRLVQEMFAALERTLPTLKLTAPKRM